MVQDKTSEHTQIVEVAERLGTLLLDTKGLNPEHWGSLENGDMTAVFHFYTAASWNATRSNLLSWQSRLYAINLTPATWHSNAFLAQL
ncbi:hypothetical protein N7541_007942 [Penicillium brevicompactum]|uniref:Uncharacterized protein n=1 Tax=Penicillium brevicompactum TaxID=5074 RepID=A0A9W9UP04_PENBR|nr:hypothetical protein N7541_007942 [Penicillium brevicompactum]